MSINKVKLPDNSEHYLKAKYLESTPTSEAKSVEFITRTTAEDATVATVRKIYGNASTVNNNLVALTATSIFARGFNQWDEEWETGTIATATGANANSQTDCRSKNYIAIFPSTEYHITNLGTANRFYVYYYDAGMVFKSYASLSSSTINNYNFTTPSDGFFMRFVAYQASTHYGMVYNQNICINISDTSKNGTYEPYNGHQIDLNIPTLTGKLNGTGSSVVIFPDGLKKISNTLFDDLTRSVANKRIGSININNATVAKRSAGVFQVSNLPRKYASGNFNVISAPYATYTAEHSKTSNIDALAAANDKSIFINSGAATIFISDSDCPEVADLKATGTLLYFEAATAEEYILDNALQLQYPVVAGGTEMVLPTTGTAPMKMDVIYGNAADATSNLSSNFMSVDSMKAFLSTLGTQMGGTWNMQYNNGKFEFTFSSS